jgi:hypothetical protein
MKRFPSGAMSKPQRDSIERLSHVLRIGMHFWLTATLRVNISGADQRYIIEIVLLH